MHELRSIVTDGPRASLLAKRAPKSRQAEEGASLASLAIPRTETRKCNQRREDRHLNRIEGAVVRFQRRKYEVTVLNVSSRGAMVEGDLQPHIGARLEIRFGDCNQTECHVRWVRNGRIGLEFAKETLIIAPAEVRDLVVSGRRAGEQPTEFAMKAERPPRQRFIMHGELHWQLGTLPVKLRNISSEGAMLEASQDLSPETDVVLDIAGAAAIPARVKWCRGGQIGIGFDSPFDLGTLAREESHVSHSDALKPDYLKTETDPDSPWAARWDRLKPEDL